MKAILITAISAAAILSTGCTTVTGQAYAGYEAAAANGIRMANDNQIKTLTDEICGVAYGAVIRNPKFIPVAKAACLPAGSDSSADTLLPTVQYVAPQVVTLTAPSK